MASRFFALVVWAAVAASVAYWGLRWLSRPTAVPANATPVSLDAAVKGDIRRLLAGPAKPASGVAENQSEVSALAGRLKLLGVIAPRDETDHAGVALLSMDGKPARAVRVGMVIDGDYVLRTLTQRSAGIGKTEGPVATTLDLPLLPPPATGMLATAPVLRAAAPSVAAMQGGQQSPPSSAGTAPAAPAAPGVAAGGQPPVMPPDGPLGPIGPIGRRGRHPAPGNGMPPPPSAQPGNS
jgi:general secretion pathway protein C